MNEPMPMDEPIPPMGGEMNQQVGGDVDAINGDGGFDADVEAEFDRENENDTQEVTVTAEFDDYVDFSDIDDYEKDGYRPCIEINLEY